jgi:cytochrome c peroxidase
MGMSSEKELVKRLSAIPEYQRQFKQVFKSDGLTIDMIAKAIATYERTLLSGNSPFARVITGQKTAMIGCAKAWLEALQRQGQMHRVSQVLAPKSFFYRLRISQYWRWGRKHSLR